MAYEPCRVCGQLRKHGDFISSDGVHVPACIHCGDEQYYDPIEDDDDE